MKFSALNDVVDSDFKTSWRFFWRISSSKFVLLSSSRGSPHSKIQEFSVSKETEGELLSKLCQLIDETDRLPSTFYSSWRTFCKWASSSSITFETFADDPSNWETEVFDAIISLIIHDVALFFKTIILDCFHIALMLNCKFQSAVSLLFAVSLFNFALEILSYMDVGFFLISAFKTQLLPTICLKIPPIFFIFTFDSICFTLSLYS